MDWLLTFAVLLEYSENRLHSLSMFVVLLDDALLQRMSSAHARATPPHQLLQSIVFCLYSDCSIPLLMTQ